MKEEGAISFDAMTKVADSADILEQSIGTRNRIGTGLWCPARQATLPGRIGSLESIPGLLKSLKIPALTENSNRRNPCSMHFVKADNHVDFYEFFILR